MLLLACSPAAKGSAPPLLQGASKCQLQFQPWRQALSFLHHALTCKQGQLHARKELQASDHILPALGLPHQLPLWHALSNRPCKPTELNAGIEEFSAGRCDLRDHSRPYVRELSGTLSQASSLRAAKMSGTRWRRHSILSVFICGKLKVMSIAKMWCAPGRYLRDPDLLMALSWQNLCYR